MGGVAKRERCVGGEVNQGGLVGNGRFSHQVAETSKNRFQAISACIQGFVKWNTRHRLKDFAGATGSERMRDRCGLISHCSPRRQLRGKRSSLPTRSAH